MEDKKNEFDDIILEKNNKNEKIKKILLRIIALVILFLVVMIVMRLINGDEASEDSIIPSEPTTQTSIESNEVGFENMPIVENDLEDQFDLLKRQIQGDVNESNSSIEAVPNLPIQNAIEDNLTQAKETQPPSLEQDESSKTQPPVPDTQSSLQKPEKAKPIQKSVVNAKPSDAKELFKDIDTVPLHASGLPLGLYVQIFSVNNLDQKSKELATVKAKGYDYKLYKTSVGGKEITKVLIGPFAKNDIASKLAKIREEIAKDAFSFELK